jgi:hypothetical protein
MEGKLVGLAGGTKSHIQSSATYHPYHVSMHTVEKREIEEQNGLGGGVGSAGLGVAGTTSHGQPAKQWLS